MKNKKLKIWHIPFLLLLIVGTYYAAKLSKEPPYQSDSGHIFGTTFSTKYQYKEDIEDEIIECLNVVDNSLSMFNENSTLSKLNRNESVDTDEPFRKVFNLAQEVSQKTNGMFDVTIAPLVNAWGFGFKNDQLPDSAQVDSLLEIVGYQKVSIEEEKLVKEDERIVMDFSAIAKGFGCDEVARLFRSKGIENFMIEIGGEVVTEGVNPKKMTWNIGINKPEDDSTIPNDDVERVVQLSNCAMATSGNYRNYYYKGDQKIAHTIDPSTGYPVQRNIISSTVIAPSCAEADAFATSFMVMGLEKAKEVLEKNTQIMAFFIYTNKEDEHKVWYSTRLQQYLK